MLPTTACGAAVVLPSTVHSFRTDVNLAFLIFYEIDSYYTAILQHAVFNIVDGVSHLLNRDTFRITATQINTQCNIVIGILHNNTKLKVGLYRLVILYRCDKLPGGINYVTQYGTSHAALAVRRK